MRRDIGDEVGVEYVDCAGRLNAVCKTKTHSGAEKGIANIGCKLGGGFAVAGQHALGIKLAAPNQNQGMKAAWLTAGGTRYLLSPGSSIGIAILIELDGAVDVGGSAAPIRMDVLAASRQAGFIGKELLLDKRMEARFLLRRSDRCRLLGLRSG